MKIFIFILITVILCFNLPNVCAQKGFSVGIKASSMQSHFGGRQYSFSRLTHNYNKHLPSSVVFKDENYSITFNNGYAYGIKFKYGVSRRIGFETAFFYTRRRVQALLTGGTNEISISFNGGPTEILEIPVNISYHHPLIISKLLFFELQFGPVIRFFNTTHFGNDEINNYNAYNYYNSNDMTSRISFQQQKDILVGINCGAGFEKDYNYIGRFYLGTTYHINPFKNIKLNYTYIRDNRQTRGSLLTGLSFLTLDFVYYMNFKKYPEGLRNDCFYF